MPASHRHTDICTGHGCFPPRPNAQASGDVIVNFLGQHRITDAWQVHCCPDVCHASTMCEGAPHVFANNLNASRIGDAVCCGSAAATGSPNVFIGNGSSGALGGSPYPDPPVEYSGQQQASLTLQESLPLVVRFPPTVDPADYLEITDVEVPDDPVQEKNPPRCDYGDGTNPYPLASAQLAEDWTESATGTPPNNNIMQAWYDIGLNPGNTDKVHWCAVFVGAILKRTGNAYIQTAASRDYETYADDVPGATITDKLNNAVQGDIVVFTRADASNPRAGHVAFFSGFSGGSTVDVLGGNQSNDVNIKAYKAARVIAVRRPQDCQEFLDAQPEE